MSKLRAAVIGIRHPHISEFFNAVRDVDGVDLVAIAEDEPQLAARARADWGVPVYADYHELLERHRPDVVGVATVNARKGDVLVTCLESGVHAIADKPLLTTFADLNRVRTAVKLGRARLSLMLTCRFDAGYQAVARFIQDGELGEIVHLSHKGPHRLRPATRGPWMLNDRDCGGILVDLGIHGFDVMRWFTGAEPQRVVAIHGNRRFPEFDNFTDHGHALVTFPGNAVGHASVDWLTPEAAPFHGDYRLFVTGTRGYCELRGANSPGELFLVTDDRPLHQVPLEPQSVTPSYDFLVALRDGREPALATRDVLRSTALSLASRDAAETGQPVDVDWTDER